MGCWGKLKNRNERMTKITICGIGPGSPDYILPKVHAAVKNSEVIVGGKRHLSLFDCCNKTTVEIKGKLEDLVQVLQNYKGLNIAILVSGDTGFHSLLRTFNRHFPGKPVSVIAGISTYQYFFAQLQMTYEDAFISSLHGQVIDFVQKVKTFPKVFLLTDTQHSWKQIAQTLSANGLGECLMHVGNNLSYPDEAIVSAKVSELVNADYSFPFCSVIIENREAANPGASVDETPSLGIADSEFIRGSVPMTKEEVRVLALSKLKLCATDHLLDIGAGTGSVSIEAARMLKAGHVTAIERKAEAIELIEANARKFGIENIDIKHGKAPEQMDGCEGVTKVFIGGSGGELPAILEWIATHATPGTQVVITAVTLNTLELARNFLENPAFELPEIIQVAITRIDRIGETAMMKANTPVWIITTKLK
jgi:precorrin-6y C5,15-methyltransferase (decarboxylating), CbiE subunit/precorrin-6Y C5,15-methyltransferase (decarboxylating), CbiT subunit